MESDRKTSSLEALLIRSGQVKRRLNFLRQKFLHLDDQMQSRPTGDPFAAVHERLRCERPTVEPQSSGRK